MVYVFYLDLLLFEWLCSNFLHLKCCFVKHIEDMNTDNLTLGTETKNFEVLHAASFPVNPLFLFRGFKFSREVVDPTINKQNCYTGKLYKY